MLRKLDILVAFGLSLATLSSTANAYLDPSTGSMILSAIVGLFATVVLAVKTYWYRLKNFFRGKRGQEPLRAGPEPPQADPEQKWGRT